MQDREGIEADVPQQRSRWDTRGRFVWKKSRHCSNAALADGGLHNSREKIKASDAARLVKNGGISVFAQWHTS